MYRDKAMKAMKQSAQTFSSHMDTADTDELDADERNKEGNMINNMEGSDSQKAATNDTTHYDPTPTCIICQLNTQEHAGPVCYLGFTQASNLLYHPSIPAVLKIDDEDDVDCEEYYLSLFFKSPKHDHVSFCGHCMHKECFDTFLAGEYSRLSDLDRRLLIDKTKCQFLCPLCKKLSNTIIPHVSNTPSVDKQSVIDSGVVLASERNIITDMTHFLESDLDLFAPRSVEGSVSSRIETSVVDGSTAESVEAADVATAILGGALDTNFLNNFYIK